MVKGPEEWFLHAVNMRHDIKMAFRLWDAVRDPTCYFPSSFPPLSLVIRLSLSLTLPTGVHLILTSHVIKKVIRAVSTAGEEIQEREHWKETDEWLAQRR